MDCQSIVRILEQQHVEYIVCVPCQEIRELLHVISEHKKFQVVLPTREDEGLGILLGLVMSGKRCLGLFQDTLLGNSQNVMGLIARCSNAHLTLWLASREGSFLTENLVHEYITGNFLNLAADSAISVTKVHLGMHNSKPLSTQVVLTLKRSINRSEQSFNIVQIVVS